MKREKEQVTSDRRSFLKLAGAGAALSGAAVAGGGAAQAKAPRDDKNGRYQSSDAMAGVSSRCWRKTSSILYTYVRAIVKSSPGL